MPSTRFSPAQYSHVKHPQWSRDAAIYQVNTRHFSAEGDFKGVQRDLPRIKSLGVDIIWLMPIHPIGEVARKGTLGSPYAVKDYLAINPEFGSHEDLHSLIAAVHDLDMKVIIDWVANHSAWDNPLTQSHPQWYARNHRGEFRPSPWWDWSDIIEFDYSHADLREYMIEAMCYWVDEFDIDGFRCDVAGYVPNDFWRQARTELEKLKPVFMLAEWEARDMHEYAFDMTYAWSWNEIMHGIAHGKLSLDKLRKYYSWNERAWPKQAYRMTFVSNNDKNAWDGTQFEQFGDCLDNAIVLSSLGEGMPLIHNGQEAGESKRLQFFECDPIEWQAHYIGDLYRQLLDLRKRFTALHNGEFGATMLQVNTDHADKVFAFVRRNGEHAVLVILNFTDMMLKVEMQADLIAGDWQEQFLLSATHQSGAGQLCKIDQPMSLDAWKARVFIQQTPWV
ncbi:alpha-amylase family glycosyl hydrolase [Alteromonas sp. ASW11-36]|uniref:Alpha-amylase family glycosyl hydrolase n=1 Tax=Alteromonas arenosi TaxID=3055817 RepID=A0ABT7SVT6_9ALTE|nr:alpha-amylase family glycosyl hydrolase [Alteromonas sp. ASW11-36]MDM7860281.1 alpha-amylase family glycosyl hydrolase [Alteromonas sp. ASW11-36]